MACQSLYEESHLASVHTNEEKDFVKEHAGNAFETSTVWIGMEIDMGKSLWKKSSC